MDRAPEPCGSLALRGRAVFEQTTYRRAIAFGTVRAAYRLWHGTGDVADAVGGGAPATIGRSRFLAVMGAGSILFFTLLILAGEVPNWFFESCF